MTDTTATTPPRPSLAEGNAPLLERLGAASAFADPATQAGIDALADKLAPLLQGQRLHNVVDLLSLLSDMVDMADDAMIQKLMKGYEDIVGGVWAIGNAARHAGHLTASQPLPGRIGLMRMAGDEDVRRGMFLVLNMMAVLGRQARPDPIAEDD